MDLYHLASIVASGLFTAALAPQAIRTWKRGRADDISLGFLLTVLSASLLMGIWASGPATRNWWIVGSQMANLIVWGYVLAVRLRHGPQPKP